MKKVLTILTIAILLQFGAIDSYSTNLLDEIQVATAHLNIIDGQKDYSNLLVQEPEEEEATEEADIMDDEDFSEDFETLFLSSSMNLWENSSPTIELQWGAATPSLTKDGWAGSFRQTGAIEARLGFTTVKNIENSTKVVKYSFWYAGFNDVRETYYDAENKDTDVLAESWRITLGAIFWGNGGYGWRIGETGMVALYTGSTINWGKTNSFENIEPESDAIAADVFGEGVHFGEDMHSGIKVRFSKYASVNAEYQMQNTYPRFLIWKWAGSSICKGIVSGLTGFFTSEIKDRVPVVVPVIDFVLQSAINFGYHELTKEKVSWPFETAPPLQQESFKVGLSFTF